MKKCLTCILAAAMLLCLPSCGNKGTELIGSNDNLPNVSAGDMPYGATITDLTPDYDSGVRTEIEFDNRFFTETDGKFPEIYKISDYLYALNNQDEEVLKSAYYPVYLDYYCESAGFEDTAAYLKSCHDELAQSLGEDFQFTYVCVSGCTGSSDAATADEFKALDARLDDIGSEKISDKITSRKKIKIGSYSMYSAGGKSSLMLIDALGKDITFYLYEIDGQLWIL